jgi:abhydrolase domain-containing protein 12
MLQKWSMSFIVDSWHSATRLANYVRVSKKVRLFIIHAKNDVHIPYTQSDGLFLAAANATTSVGMDSHLINKMTARATVHMGEGAFIRTWKAENKIIREQIVSHGGELLALRSFDIILKITGHNRIITYAPVALAVLKAFGLDDD